MSGKHASPKRTKRAGSGLRSVLIAAVIFLIGAAVIWFVMRDQETADPQAVGKQSTVPQCQTKAFTVAATPEIASVLTELLKANCPTLTVVPTASSAVLAAIDSGNPVSQLWVPDSSLWIARVAASPPEIAEASIAASPVVWATKDRNPNTWTSVLYDDGFVSGDPLTSTASGVPLFASQQEETANQVPAAQITSKLVPVAQRYAGGTGIADDAKRLAAVAAKGGVTVVSEQAALAANVTGINLVAPTNGTIVLDYPIALTVAGAREADATEAADWIAQTLHSQAGRVALQIGGFRSAADKPVADRGVGPVTTLTITDPAVITTALQTWARLALPTRTLAVIDVSGSMGFDASEDDDTTRMELTTRAAQEGLGLFPNTAAIGLWRFSEKLDGDRDYVPMVPIRKLSQSVAGTTQRDLLRDEIAKIDFIVGTATGLYDTILAAYRQVLSTYDPKSVNSVLLFTDGENEDPGSISEEELLAELKKLADPARPVPIITIAISDDADVGALQAISRATGGTSYLARDPRDIGDVFKQAVSARSGGA